ncbi:hypothetical protein [Roseateles puraquae]|nr:hypothetical protein [Roseateles puraquae]MDG0854099.1 hypothetical protein [Roseateles puraquae]
MNVADILPPAFNSSVKSAIEEKSFDPAGLVTEFRRLANVVAKKVAHVSSIDDAFTALDVEFERVGSESAEVGFLLPREVVGETLKDLTGEFNQLSKLVRAVNELVGAADYDPRVVTISSSWWQVFLDLDPNQILVWVLAIERISNLFKSNLEIKHLQRQLGEKQVASEITELLDREIEKRVAAALQDLAVEIRRDHAKIADDARLNEVETQLRHGLYYLAKRMNQGAQIEINVGIPEEPNAPQSDSDEGPPDVEFQARLAEAKARIAKLRDLRTRARAASAETLNLDTSAHLLLTQDLHIEQQPNGSSR